MKKYRYTRKEKELLDSPLYASLEKKREMIQIEELLRKDFGHEVIQASSCTTLSVDELISNDSLMEEIWAHAHARISATTAFSVYVYVAVCSILYAAVKSGQLE